MLDIASSTSLSSFGNTSTVQSSISRPRIRSSTPALTSRILTTHALPSPTSVTPASHRLRPSTSYRPQPTASVQEKTAPPTEAVTSQPTLGPLAAKLPLFAVISGVLGLILLLLLIYIVSSWRSCVLCNRQIWQIQRDIKWAITLCASVWTGYDFRSVTRRGLWRLRRARELAIKRERLCIFHVRALSSPRLTGAPLISVFLA